MSETAQQTEARPQPKAAPSWPKDPVVYLQSKGWEADGDPRHPRTLWLDPARPKTDKQERRLVGQRTLSNNKTEDVYQTFVTPRVMGCTLDEAVSEQLRRDRV